MAEIQGRDRKKYINIENITNDEEIDTAAAKITNNTVSIPIRKHKLKLQSLPENILDLIRQRLQMRSQQTKITNTIPDTRACKRELELHALLA